MWYMLPHISHPKVGLFVFAFKVRQVHFGPVQGVITTGAYSSLQRYEVSFTTLRGYLYLGAHSPLHPYEVTFTKVLTHLLTPTRYPLLTYEVSIAVDCYLALVFPEPILSSSQNREPNKTSYFKFFIIYEF